MTPESTLRRSLIKRINKLEYAECMAVENFVTPGTPDMNGIYKKQEFWIELKSIERWGKIHHFTPQQKIWILKRGSQGGKVFLLVQKERFYKLLSWRQAMNIYANGISQDSPDIYHTNLSIEVKRMLEVIVK